MGQVAVPALALNALAWPAFIGSVALPVGKIIEGFGIVTNIEGLVMGYFLNEFLAFDTFISTSDRL